MKLLKEAKANLTDELIDVVLKSETDDKEYDVGYYFGVENPNDIPTEELEEHAYKSIRILIDHFGA
mgnify:CR=1 FL=1